VVIIIGMMVDKGIVWIFGEILVGISCRAVTVVEIVHFVLWLLAFEAGNVAGVNGGVERFVIVDWHHRAVWSAVKVAVVIMTFDRIIWGVAHSHSTGNSFETCRLSTHWEKSGLFDIQ